MSKYDAKIAILQLIRDKRDILFGAFTDKLSKDARIAEWKNILLACKSLGLVPANKDYTYIRDIFWSNLKRAAVARKDNAHKSGTGDGKNSKFSPMDDIVLEIISKNSSVTNGIAIKDLSGFAEIYKNDDRDQNANVTIPDIQPAGPAPKTNQNSSTNLIKNKKMKIVHKGSSTYTQVCEERLKKRRKLDLEIEYLELKNYKLKLEALELERKLVIPPSKYTAEIHSWDPIIKTES